MSGGVDSSVAALTLIESGLDVVGVTLRLYDSCAGSARACCGLEDAADAAFAARLLGIEHRVLEHQAAFRRLVIEPSAAEYAAGRTPNPCVLCNERVKFGTLWEYAREHGFHALATGHYARVLCDRGRFALLRGLDREKDQSYFLFSLDPAILPHVRFPLGDSTKARVRERARAAGLPVAEKPESQDVCFGKDGEYARIVEEILGPQPGGPVRHADGRLLGRHEGLHRFTVGQRRGLGIPAREALYVLSMDGATKEMTVGQKRLLGTERFAVKGWRWLAEVGPPPVEAEVQVRYRQGPRPARLTQRPESLVVEWLAGPSAASPGQAAVAYRGDTVLGGGWIEGPLP
jgi:tRNA-specific 2-thiouridylase